MSNVNASARPSDCITDDLRSSLEKLESSSFYKQFVKDMERPEFVEQIQRVTGSNNDDDYPYCSELVQLVVYGIGSIAYSEGSQLQLCLAILMKKNCEWIDDVVVYDPILTVNELEAIRSFFKLHFSLLHLSLPSENENGKRRVARPTLFFMPHCPFHLINNVLEANWKVEKLNKIIILGNSFRDHKVLHDDIHSEPWDKVDPTDLDLDADRHILGIQKNSYTVELPVPETCREVTPPFPAHPPRRPVEMSFVAIDLTDDVWMYAFSNTSWHFFVADASTDLNLLLS